MKLKKEINELKTFIADSWITLTSNEIKDIIKLITSLEKSEILLKEPTEKVINQKVGFLGPLINVGLPLTKNVRTSSAKSVQILFGLTVAASVTVAAIQKKIYVSSIIWYTDNLEQWNERYHENS